MKKYIITSVLILGLFEVSIGQQVYFLNVKDGLSSRYTHGVEQDHKGLMWFATNEGVDRYDGNEFRRYKLHTSVINPTELGYRFNIVCDTANVIWAYTTSGKIFRYSQFSDAFELKIDLQKDVGNYQNIPYVNTIFFDRSNIVWIGTNVGTYYAKLSGSGLQKVYLYSNVQSRCFAQSASGYIWAGTPQGVKILYLDDSFPEKAVEKDLLYTATKDKLISALFYDSLNQKLWLGSIKHGPSVFDFRENKWTDLSKSTPHVPVRSIVKDSQNSILIGLDGAGIRRLDANNYQVKNVWVKTEDIPGAISDNSVLDIYCDAEERIWVSTWYAGITIIDFQKPKLKFIKHVFNNENSILSSQINSILEDSDGHLWFGTNSGISVLNTSSNRWDHLFNIENSDKISAYKIFTIAEDNRKRIWIGGYANGLHCYDKKNKKLTDFTAKAGTIYIYSAYYDNSDNMWFGGMEGLLTKYDMKLDIFSKYNIRNVTVTLNKDKNQLWVGAASGLFIVDKNSDRVIPYAEFASNMKEISNRYINCLYQDQEDRLWIGTDGGGLNLFDPSKKKISVFSTEEGLPSNFIYGIFSDKLGRIWLSTDKGIGCVDPATNRCINIGFIEEFTNFPFNRNSHTKLRSGDLVLGGLHGAVVFSPELIQPYKSKSRLLLNEFRVSYQRVLPADANSPLKQPIDLASEIKLNYNQNSFSFSFSSINYDNNPRLTYQWKLEGFESEWSTLTSSKTAGYTNIPPGDYTFKIRCNTQNNLAFDDERQIAIRIQPPFWKTDLAFMVYFLLFSGLSWLIYSLEQNRLQKKHASDKISFFINTAHDIKTPVSLIKAPLKDMEADKGITSQGLYYLKIAQSNAEKLSRIVNQILDFDRVDSKKAKLLLSNNNLASYLEEKIVSYQLLADDNDIRFKYNLPDADLYVMFDEDKMNKIIDNMISNAIKYTPPKGSVGLTVKVNEKDWTLEIADTGIGILKKDRKNLFTMYYRADNAINSKKSGSGIGLMLVQNLVRMHGGKISYTSKENLGSTFVLSFPRIPVSKNKNSSPVISFPHKVPEEQQPLVNKAVAASQIPEIPQSQVKVLIVEDDYELRNYLVSTLGKQFHVYSADDGQLGLDMAQNEKFSLIISDVMLPSLRGDELCKKIKTNINTSHIPVILLTALSDKENTIIGLEAGADSYITKPFDIEIVHTQINNILKNRQLICESLLKGINPNTDKVTINNLDKILIKDILNIVERELADPQFSITNLCRETAMSRTLLYNKIKVHTGLAPNEFIRIVRMNKAMDLLKSGQHPISEIAHIVGFEDSKYFSTAFKKFFGKSPKHYHPASSESIS